MRKKCSSDREKPSKFKAEGREYGIYYAISKTIYSNSESSDQFWKQNTFLTCSWKFITSNILEQLKLKFEKNIGIQKSEEKVRKLLCSYYVYYINSICLYKI